MIIPIKQIIMENNLTIIPPLKIETEKLKLDTPEKAFKFTKRAANMAANNIIANGNRNMLVGAGLGATLAGASGAGLFHELADANPLSTDDSVSDATLIGSGLGATIGGIYGTIGGQNVSNRNIKNIVKDKSGAIINRLDKHNIKAVDKFGAAMNDLNLRMNIAKRILKKQRGQ